MLVEPIDAERVFETFRLTPEAAPGSEDWKPKEVAVFSKDV